MKPKKIIFIGTTGSSFYGFRADLIRSLVANGHQVYTFTSEYSEGCLEKIKALGAEPITYQLSRGGLNPFADLRTLKWLKQKITVISPDIVFAYFTKPVIYGSLAAKLSNVPKVIAMLEGLGSPFTLHQHGQSIKIKVIKVIQINLYRITFPYIDKIIFLNHDDPLDLVKKYAIQHKPDAIEVLGAIGLNLETYSFKTWDESTPISFIFIARLIAEKGVYDFIEAAKIVKKQYPKAIFTLIGGLDRQNPYGLKQVELDTIVKEGVVEYHGFVDDVATKIQNSAVFVLPSYYREGVPRSTQEAMAIGRPVITTDVPGCRETVVNGVNGFLVPKWNPQALAEKMIYFIEHPEQINIMGAESHKIAVENFNAEKVNQKLLNIMGL